MDASGRRWYVETFITHGTVAPLELIAISFRGEAPIYDVAWILNTPVSVRIKPWRPFIGAASALPLVRYLQPPLPHIFEKQSRSLGHARRAIHGMDAGIELLR